MSRMPALPELPGLEKETVKVRFALKAPCDTCPFRPDVPGFLHPHRAREIAEGMLLADEIFICHKTVRYSDEGEDEDRIPHAEEQACAGALLFCLGQGRLPQLARIAQRLKLFEPEAMRGEGFRTTGEFIRHMEGERRIRDGNE